MRLLYSVVKQLLEYQNSSPTLLLSTIKVHNHCPTMYSVVVIIGHKSILQWYTWCQYMYMCRMSVISCGPWHSRSIPPHTHKNHITDLRLRFLPLKGKPWPTTLACIRTHTHIHTCTIAIDYKIWRSGSWQLSELAANCQRPQRMQLLDSNGICYEQCGFPLVAFLSRHSWSIA